MAEIFSKTIKKYLPSPTAGLEMAYQDVTKGYSSNRIPLSFEISYLDNEKKKATKVISMLVNPNNMSVKRQSTVTSYLTRDGLVNQYWRPQADQIVFKGIAAGDKSMRILCDLKNIVDSINLKTQIANNTVKLKYKGNSYEGYLSGITIEVDAENPKIFNYEFTFTNTGENSFDFSDMSLRYDTLKINYEASKEVLSRITGAAEVTKKIPKYIDTTVKMLSVSEKIIQQIQGKI